ncbi:hypothetical protein [Kitasatospora aureofaciens]|uniref:hypothetical protein n=1 Tax=Kitasatospora aureofaciens TaxID=1894 RepID=UPI001C43B2C0|nr:hypothetical protein [Kitasatospora aureofaciens]
MRQRAYQWLPKTGMGSEPVIVGIPVGIDVGTPVGIPAGIGAGIPEGIPVSLGIGIPDFPPVGIPVGIPESGSWGWAFHAAFLQDG